MLYSDHHLDCRSDWTLHTNHRSSLSLAIELSNLSGLGPLVETELIG